MSLTGLANSLGLVSPMVVSLIGAGGKTTLLYRLGIELADCGYPVLLTTTTNMYYPAPGQADKVILSGAFAADDLAPAIAGSLLPGRRLFLARRKEGPKVVGLEPAVIGELAPLFPEAYILVEADGAKRRPLKGYASHEPVVPPVTGLLIGVAGLDAVGRPLKEEWVHRPEMVSAVTGLKPYDELTPQAVAMAVAEGLRRGHEAAPGAAVVTWLNQAEGRLGAGRYVARVLLCQATVGVEKVILGSAAGDPAVLEVWPSHSSTPSGIAGVILAAGTSSRLPGKNKLLLPLGGKSIIQHVVETALELPLNPIVVVLGNQAQMVAAALDGLPAARVFNPDFARGQSTSLKAGLAALNGDVRAAVFFLGDQPLVRPRMVEELISAYLRTGAPVVYPVYEGRRGNPVLFDRRTFGDLSKLEGDEGGRGLITDLGSEALAVPVREAGILQDIDTMADYDRVRKSF